MADVTLEMPKIDRKDEKLPRWNFWRCNVCAGYFVAVEVSKGLVPLKLMCKSMPGAAHRGNGHCSGVLVSAEHPNPAVWPMTVPRVPDAEMYVPGEYARAQLAKKYPMLHRLILQGGLVWRPTSDRTPKFPTSEGTGYGG